MKTKKIAGVDCEQVILDMLSYGRFTGKEIRFQIYKVTRKKIKGFTLRRLVRGLRLQGYVIIADKNGYRFACSREDARIYIESRQREIYSELDVLTAMRRSHAYQNLQEV